MRYLLILPLIVYTLEDSFNLPLHLGPGLSLKTAVLYLVGLILALRMATRGGYKLELRVVLVSFTVLIAYALFSVLVAGVVIHYDGYRVSDSLISLKYTLIDSALVFGLFFYGTRTTSDGVLLTKALVAAVTAANIISIASIKGYIDIPGVTGTAGQVGRAEGAFGDANETAALIAAMIPAYVAIARSSGGLWRLIWIAGGMTSFALLLMTASRGALVAMLIGYPWAAYVFRRYVSLPRILLWGGISVALGVVIVGLAGPHFVGLLLERLVTESGASDIDTLSSGRLGIWARGLGKMMATPIVLLTGFGWNTWSTMGFYFAAHNGYLLIWFELGLVGLCSYMLLLLRSLWTVRSAVDRADPLSRGYLMAFVFGFGAFLIALFFVNIYQPWPYVWAYAGVSLRMALIGVAGDTPVPARAADDRKRQLDLLSRTAVARASRLPDPAVNAPSSSLRYDPSGAIRPMPQPRENS